MIAITHNYSLQSESLSNVFWEKPINTPKLNPNDVHIWKVKVSDHYNYLFKNYRFVLNEDEYKKAKKFYREHDCKKYITGRIVLRKLLAQYLNKPAASLEFKLKGRKPCVVSERGLKYNLSYSGQYILIAIAQCETGVDVEKLNQSFEVDSLLSAFFAPEEVNDIKTDAGKTNALFYLHWTRKEAILKFTGQGIIDDLTVVPSLDGSHILDNKKLRIEGNIKLSSFNLDHDCIASLVCPDYVVKKEFFEW